MKRQCGVYAILNTATNMRYIGSSKNIKKRLYSHSYQLVRRSHYNKRLQKDYDMFGPGAFVAHILELCEEDKLLEREMIHINATPADQRYNIIVGRSDSSKCDPSLYRSKNPRMQLAARIRWSGWVNPPAEWIEAQKRELGLIS